MTKITTKSEEARKPVSAAKIAANRRNATKSTGPKTAEGKAISRWNSIRHGMLAQFLSASKAAESVEFAHLLSELRVDRQPVGALEEILVEKIALGYLRLKRAAAHEGEVEESLGSFLANMEKFARYMTALQRALSLDIHDLERLQRQRLGGFVPPPLAIDVNVLGNNGCTHEASEPLTAAIDESEGAEAETDGKQESVSVRQNRDLQNLCCSTSEEPSTIRSERKTTSTLNPSGDAQMIHREFRNEPTVRSTRIE